VGAEAGPGTAGVEEKGKAPLPTDGSFLQQFMTQLKKKERAAKVDAASAPPAEDTENDDEGPMEDAD
jgi:hypothetical protein